MQKLKRLRELAGLTQVDLAKRSGVDRARLSMAECGHVVLSSREKELVRSILLRALEGHSVKLRAELEESATLAAEV